jgi:hypothetical protein
VFTARYELSRWMFKVNVKILPVLKWCVKRDFGQFDADDDAKQFDADDDAKQRDRNANIVVIFITDL